MAGWLPLFQSQSFKTIQNVGSLGQSGAFTFINFWKTCDTDVSRLNGNSPALLNNDGYPSTGPLTANMALVMTLPNYSGASTAQWVLKWTGTLGTGSIGLVLQHDLTVVSNTGTTITNTGVNTRIKGTNARMVFTFNSGYPGNQANPVNQFNAYFENGCTFSGLSNIILCRVSDETAVDGGAIWTPEFLASMTALNPGVIRMMGPTCGGSGSEVVSNGSWAYRVPTTAMSYGLSRQYVPNIWCGTITNSGTAYTAPSYTDMPGTYQDGDVFMGIATTCASVVVSAVATSSGKVKLTIPTTASMTTGDQISYDGYNTASMSSYMRGIWTITVLNGTDFELTTSWTNGLASVFVASTNSNNGSIGTATINSGARGKRPVTGLYFPSDNKIANDLFSGGGATGQTTFVYRALTKSFYAAPNSMFCGVNPELLVNLCNTLNKNMWLNLNFWTTDATATSALTYVKNNLNAGLSCALEWTNETFNGNFKQFYACWDSAIALNIGVSTGGTFNAANTMAFAGLRSAMLYKLAATAWGGRTASQLKPTLTNWATQSGSFTDFQNEKLNGASLNASTNSVLSAYTGGQRYDQGSPNFNRPIDTCRLISCAPYMFIGNQDISDYISYAQSYAAGSTTTALNNFDTAVRGATTTKYTGVGNCYDAYEAMAASYDGVRPSGFANVEVWAYEGGPEIAGPNGEFFPAVVSDYVTAGYSVSRTVTFNIGTHPSVNWTVGTPVNGTTIGFTGGTLPAEIQDYVTGVTSKTQESQRIFYVINSSPGVGFDIASRYTIPSLGTAITLSGSPSGTTTGVGAQYSIDNVVIAWSQDARAQAWVNFYCGQIVPYPHWKRMCFLQLDGYSPWSLYPGTMATTPFKTFDGITAFNAGAQN